MSFDRFPALAQKVVTVSAEVELGATAQPQLLADPGAWLTAERSIESYDPQIRLLALELRRAKELESARALYEWVQGNMRVTSPTTWAL